MVCKIVNKPSQCCYLVTKQDEKSSDKNKTINRTHTIASITAKKVMRRQSTNKVMFEDYSESQESYCESKPSIQKKVKVSKTFFTSIIHFKLIRFLSKPCYFLLFDLLFKESNYKICNFQEFQKIKSGNTRRGSFSLLESNKYMIQNSDNAKM